MKKRKTKEELEREEQEKKKKEEEKDKQDELYLSKLDEQILEKTLTVLHKSTDVGLESIKSVDNKASLLLVLYVGIFTIFACFFDKINLVDIYSFVLFCITICSYIVSMIFLLCTIANKAIKVDSISSAIPSNNLNYKTWLIKQIIEKNKQYEQRAISSDRKSKLYKKGSIALMVSVCLTLILSVFTVCL